MKKSKIYDLIESSLLFKWQDKIEETEKDSWFFERVLETFNELEKELNDGEKKLLKSYSLAIENKLEYVNYSVKIMVLNLGIKIGMELEKSFAEFEE